MDLQGEELQNLSQLRERNEELKNRRNNLAGEYKVNKSNRKQKEQESASGLKAQLKEALQTVLDKEEHTEHLSTPQV